MKILAPIPAIAILSLLLFVSGLLFLDKIVLGLDVGSGIQYLLAQLVLVLDMVTLNGVSIYVLGVGLLVLAVAANLGGFINFGAILSYVGCVQFTTVVVTVLAKWLFARLGPVEVLADPALTSTWFAGGSSFPSSHAAIYAGLFLPLMVVWPRLSLLWLVVPVLVAAQRVLSDAHYLSDVSIAFVIACVAALVFTYRDPYSPL